MLVASNSLYTMRKNQFFKWTLSKTENMQLTKDLLRFLNQVGFAASDTLECQLLHETKGYSLQGNFSLMQLEKQSLRNLTIFCDTPKYKNSRKFIRTENENGFGVFFSTLGVRKAAQQVRFHFVDVDLGKQTHMFQSKQEAEDFISRLNPQDHASVTLRATHAQWLVKRTFKGNVIQSKKAAYLVKYKSDLSNLLITETANGFHLYFPIQDGDVAQFSKVQHALACYFEGDTSVTDHARILRLPFTYHMKNPDNPYYVKVLQWGDTEHKYTQSDLLARFATAATQDNHAAMPTTYHVESQDTLQLIQPPLPASLSFSAFVEEIKHVPLAHLLPQEVFKLSLGQSFPCLFHDSTQASATVYMTDAGVYFYKCFAEDCKVSVYTVIDIVMAVNEMTFIEAVHHLAQQVNVTIEETELEKQKYRCIHQNFQWLKTNIECRTVKHSSKPQLYTFFTKSMFIVAKEIMAQLLSYPFKDEWTVDGHAVFFMSAEYLAEQCRLSKRSVQISLDSLVLLGFIRKLGAKEVPRSLHYKVKGKRAINYYVLYTFDECAQGAEELAAQLNQQKFQKKQLSAAYVERMLGTEYKQRVYPNDAATYTQYTQQSSVAAWYEQYLKGYLQKKGYIKEDALKIQIQVHFNHLPAGKEGKVQREVFNHLKQEGFQRVRLSKKLAVQYKLKKYSTRDHIIYIWTKPHAD